MARALRMKTNSQMNRNSQTKVMMVIMAKLMVVTMTPVTMKRTTQRQRPRVLICVRHLDWGGWRFGSGWHVLVVCWRKSL